MAQGGAALAQGDGAEPKLVLEELNDEYLRLWDERWCSGLKNGQLVTANSRVFSESFKLSEYEKALSKVKDQGLRALNNVLIENGDNEEAEKAAKQWETIWSTLVPRNLLDARQTRAFLVRAATDRQLPPLTFVPVPMADWRALSTGVDSQKEAQARSANGVKQAWKAQLELKAASERVEAPSWSVVREAQLVDEFISTTENENGALTLADLAGLPDRNPADRARIIARYGLVDREIAPSIIGAGHIPRLIFEDFIPVFLNVTMALLPEWMRSLLSKKGFTPEIQQHTEVSAHTFFFANDEERYHTLLRAASVADQRAQFAALPGEQAAVGARLPAPAPVAQPEARDTILAVLESGAGVLVYTVSTGGGAWDSPLVYGHLQWEDNLADDAPPLAQNTDSEDTAALTLKEAHRAASATTEIRDLVRSYLKPRTTSADGTNPEGASEEAYKAMDREERAQLFDIAYCEWYIRNVFRSLSEAGMKRTDASREAVALMQKNEVTVKENDKTLTKAGDNVFKQWAGVHHAAALLPRALEAAVVKFSGNPIIKERMERFFGVPEDGNLGAEYSLKVYDRLGVCSIAEATIACIKAMIIRRLRGKKVSEVNAAVFAKKCQDLERQLRKLGVSENNNINGENESRVYFPPSFTRARYNRILNHNGLGFSLQAPLKLDVWVAPKARGTSIDSCASLALELRDNPDNILVGFELQNAALALKENKPELGQRYVELVHDMVQAYQCGSMTQLEFKESYFASISYSRLTPWLHFEKYTNESGQADWSVRERAKPKTDPLVSSLLSEMRQWAPVPLWTDDLIKAIESIPSDAVLAPTSQSARAGATQTNGLHRRSVTQGRAPSPAADDADARPRHHHRHHHHHSRQRSDAEPPAWRTVSPAAREPSPRPRSPDAPARLPTPEDAAEPEDPKEAPPSTPPTPPAVASYNPPAAEPAAFRFPVQAVHLPRFLEALATLAPVVHELVSAGRMNALVVPSDASWAPLFPMERDVGLRYLNADERLTRTLMSLCFYRISGTVLEHAKALLAQSGAVEAHTTVDVDATPYVPTGARLRLDLHPGDLYSCLYTLYEVTVDTADTQHAPFSAVRVSCMGTDAYASCASGDANLAMDDALHRRDRASSKKAVPSTAVSVYVLAVDLPPVNGHDGAGRKLAEQYARLARALTNAAYATPAATAGVPTGAAVHSPGAAVDAQHGLRSNTHPLLRARRPQAETLRGTRQTASRVVETFDHHDTPLAPAGYSQAAAAEAPQAAAPPAPLAPLLPYAAPPVSLTPYFPGGSPAPLSIMRPAAPDPSAPLIEAQRLPAPGAAPPIQRPVERFSDGLPVPKVGMQVVYNTQYNGQACSVTFTIVHVDPSLSWFIASAVDGTAQNVRFERRAGPDGRPLWAPV